MNSNGIIVGLGEALWDCLPEGRKLGGAPANFAYHVSQFGLRGCAVSAIGDDKLGEELIEKFDANHLHYKVDKVPYPTGTVQVEIDKAGIPQYDIKENVAWDNIPYTEELAEIARCSSAVCFGSLAQRSAVSRQTIGRFLDEMPSDPDVLKVFDINLRQKFYNKEILSSSLERCNVLKINDEELETVSLVFDCRDNDIQDKCRTLLRKFNLKMLILTCGVNGSYVFTPGNVSFRETPKVDVVDTVGAGDSFTAAFISSIIKGKSVEQAHKTAVEVSAFVCTQAGAMPTLPAELL